MFDLFISKSNPLFGASPDGMFNDGEGILEIKCPYSLRNTEKKDVKDGHFYTCDGTQLNLRHSHTYFFQVQLQMFVTGAKYTDFFI